MKSPNDLSRRELVRIVSDIQAVLWLDLDKDGDAWDPDKEWDSSILEYVAVPLINAGLRPDRKE